MLRWSAETTGRRIEITSITDRTVDPGIEGGAALAAMARSVPDLHRPDAGPVSDVAEQLGGQAATDAAAVAAAFEGLNRIVDGVGLPIGRAARRDQADLIEILGLSSFPHASHGA